MSQQSIDELESLKLRDDIGHESNIRLLIRLCYLAVGDDDLFARRVDLLLRQLPKAVKKKDKFQEKLDECTITPEPRWHYERAGRYRMGTPENPVVDEETGRVISPIWVQDEPYTDWMAVFELCLDQFEAQGTTWHKDEGAGAI